MTVHQRVPRGFSDHADDPGPDGGHGDDPGLDAGARAVRHSINRIAATAGELADSAHRQGLVSATRQLLARILQSLTGLAPAGTPPVDGSRALGERCARSGVPIASLIATADLGADLLWSALQQAPTEQGRPEPARLAAESGRYWRCVQDHTQAVREGHARCRQSPSPPHVQGSHGQGDDPAGALIARAGNLPGSAGAVLAVCVLGCRTPVAAHRLEAALADAGIASAWVTSGRNGSGLIVAERGESGALPGILARHLPGRVGLAPPGPLLKARDALAVALWTARSLPSDRTEVAAAEDRLPAVLVAAAPALAPLLTGRGVTTLLSLPPALGGDLVRTVEALLAEDGSPTGAGERLFCHRNTVMYRMQRVQEVTGRGMAGTEDKLMWSLALLAQQIHGGAEETS
ncbi:PucR family transcriptional regulator [Streptomyces sp. HNM0575]|uniref:helix-turn-helix domain-containing protein n=1 Tax=Streptomyces sp. HNM0575 TaxID=2716338 RepID=UPI00145C8E4D|nr:helix-turn-helix domain-containing protein [Streptomyces sp. HNM0575]NLU74022.1 PucR family transcriptional regulator [Streptomyces sp. HNM0575]